MQSVADGIVGEDVAQLVEARQTGIGGEPDEAALVFADGKDGIGGHAVGGGVGLGVVAIHHKEAVGCAYPQSAVAVFMDGIDYALLAQVAMRGDVVYAVEGACQHMAV